MVEREGAAQTPFLWRRIRTNHRARDESKRANTVRPYGGVCVSRGMGYIKKTGEHSVALHLKSEKIAFKIRKNQSV